VGVDGLTAKQVKVKVEFDVLLDHSSVSFGGAEDFDGLPNDLGADLVAGKNQNIW
jgi:hypothetical protein